MSEVSRAGVSGASIRKAPRSWPGAIISWGPRAGRCSGSARGAPLEIVVFTDATHAFEDAQAQDLRVRYDPAATAREHDLLRAMIAGL